MRLARSASQLLALCMAFWPLGSRAQQNPANKPDAGPAVRILQSTDDLKESLVEKPSLSFGTTRLPVLTITVNDSIAYQEIDGFGASLTDSSAWVLSHKLDDAQRRSVLENLFDPVKGIGISLLRQPMGASDFALTNYSYDDLPQGQTDPDLAHFSISHDEQYILPVLRQALQINPRLKIMASPWSPPGWMKTSGSLIQGSLVPNAYPALAKYFVKFVQSYTAAGVPIYAITPQNEPMFVPNDYSGMGMTATEQKIFIRDHLGPAFRAAGLKTKILVFDHNWDLIRHPIAVLSDLPTAAFADGIAIHCYGGTPTVQSELHDRFPTKDIWLTECSGGDWQSGHLLGQQVGLIIGATRNWARSVVLWNLALDQNHGPYNGGCVDCRGVVTVNDSVSPSTVTNTVDFTALGHASKFLVPGAHRVESNTFGQGSLEDVAFRNPDGSIVLLVLNSGSRAHFNVRWGGKYFSYELRGGSVATFFWTPGPSSQSSAINRSPHAKPISVRR